MASRPHTKGPTPQAQAGTVECSTGFLPFSEEEERGPLCVWSTTELTVLLTPLIFMIRFFRMSRNSSMSLADTKETMSNSPVTSYNSSMFGMSDSSRTTSSMNGESTKMSTNARSRVKAAYRAFKLKSSYTACGREHRRVRSRNGVNFLFPEN